MKNQISESIPCGILLTISGGCMDAYSYLFRDHVFANAQTGNMLLFGVNLASGNFASALKYAWPVLAFALGIMIADWFEAKKENTSIHWRQINVFIEALILAGVAFIPTQYNALANALTSFVCGIQLESFRKIQGNVIATTMCIGNLRSGTNNLDLFIKTKDRSYLQKALLYYGIIICFIFGAILESVLIKQFGAYAILLSTVVLLITFVFMFYQSKQAH